MKKIHFAALTLLAAAAAPGFAADCSTTVEANDAMQFSTKAITVPAACKSFDVTLKHVGKLPKTAMGHNFVVSLASDEAAVAADGMTAGAAAEYVKAGDARVIAHSKVVGGGESTKVSIPVGKLKAGTAYAFFCSFPGHATIMKGTLALAK
jgi:azurin